MDRQNDKMSGAFLMLAEKLEPYFDDDSCYVSELPAGMSYPDEDPYILELKRRNPDALWDRYVPSEVIIERMKIFYETLWAEDAATARNFPEFDMPAGLWEYNPMWEFEWEEEPERVKQNFRKPRRPDE
jgi:hypothetical protein